MITARHVVALAAFVALLMAAPGARAANVTERTQYFVFVYPETSETAVGKLMEHADRTLLTFGTKLGKATEVVGGPPIEVMVTATKEDFFAAQPAKGLDTWVAGTAYPGLHLIILSLAPDQFFNLPEIFRHEISHIALHRAAGHGFVPRWLDEGLAILMAGETVAGRFEAAAGAATSGNLIPLSELSAGFPAEGTPARLAYAESVLFIRFLQRSHAFDARLPALLDRMRSGAPFEMAFERTFGAPLPTLEADWAEGLARSSWWVTLISSASVIWALAGALFIFAWWRLRRRRQVRLRALALADSRGGASYDDEHDEIWPATPVVLPRTRSFDEALPDDDERIV